MEAEHAAKLEELRRRAKAQAAAQAAAVKQAAREKQAEARRHAAAEREAKHGDGAAMERAAQSPVLRTAGSTCMQTTKQRSELLDLGLKDPRVGRSRSCCTQAHRKKGDMARLCTLRAYRRAVRRARQPEHRSERGCATAARHGQSLGATGKAEVPWAPGAQGDGRDGDLARYLGGSKFAETRIGITRSLASKDLWY